MKKVISKRNFSVRYWTLFAIRLFIGGLFVFSGGIKLLDLVSFKDTIAEFGILPEMFENAATVLIPTLEVVCGLLLIAGFFKKGASFLLSVLLGIFVIAIGTNLYRGNIIECGCFGSIEIFATISMYSIFLDLFLLLFCYVLITNSEKENDIPSQLNVLIPLIVFTTIIVNIPFYNNNLEFRINLRNRKLINMVTAFENIENHNAYLIDARLHHRYMKEHIPGAISVPYDQFQKFYNDIGFNDVEAPIFVYCDGLRCNAAKRVVSKFLSRGHTNVLEILGGMKAWHTMQLSK